MGLGGLGFRGVGFIGFRAIYEEFFKLELTRPLIWHMQTPRCSAKA